MTAARYSGVIKKSRWFKWALYSPVYRGWYEINNRKISPGWDPRKPGVLFIMSQYTFRAGWNGAGWDQSQFSGDMVSSHAVWRGLSEPHPQWLERSSTAKDDMSVVAAKPIALWPFDIRIGKAAPDLIRNPDGVKPLHVTFGAVYRQQDLQDWVIVQWVKDGYPQTYTKEMWPAALRLTAPERQGPSDGFAKYVEAEWANLNRRPV